MTNFLQAATGGGSQDLAPLEDIAASLATVNMLACSNTGNPFLKLEQKTSDWVFGRDLTPVMDDDLWAVNPQSFEKGYIAWGDSRNVLAESMVPASMPLPGLETLPQIPSQFKYYQQLKIDLASVDQPDDVTVTFKTTAFGGKTAIGEVGQMVHTVDHAGEAFGWSSLIDRDVYSASAECRKDTILQKFDRRTLQKIIEEDSPNGIIFFKRLAGTIGYRLLCSYKMISASAIADTTPTLGSGQIEHSESVA